jgi:hypothetical protein
MALMPSAILATGCSICNSLFLINVNTKYASIITDQTYVNSTQFWFIVVFNFSGSSFVPDFQFTIQINPNYASFFSAQDNAQVLNGAFSQTQFSASATTPPIVVNPTTGGGVPGPIPHSPSTGPNPGNGGTVPIAPTIGGTAALGSNTALVNLLFKKS